MPAVKGLSRSSQWIIKVALGSRRGSGVNQLIDKWLETNGTEWTVKRLKAYWDAAKQLRAGNNSVVKTVYQENWIAYNKGTLIPEGPIGKVVEEFVRGQRPSVIRRSALVLRVYTALRLTRESDLQYQKAKAAITKPSTFELDEYRFKEFFARTVKEDPLFRVGTLQAPDLSRLKAFSSYHRAVGKVNSELEKLPYGKLAVSLVTNPFIPPSLRELNPLEDVRQELLYLATDMGDPEDEPATLGKISFLQEGGAKCRVVATPNAWTQWLFEPLHKELDRVIRTLPNSAVHDQNRGAFYMRAHLEAGNPLWCFDLSSATDRFPLSLQIHLLKLLGLSEYAEALSESTWEWIPDCDHWLGGPLWHYAAGQPMGLYGSFPLFHLTHYIALQTIAKCMCKLTGTELRGSFLVLGDDVIISHPALAESYAKMMTLFGVELSVSKSISSSTVGEFAGFVGVKTNKSVAVFRPYKWGKTESIRNLVPFLNSMGSRLKTVSPRWGRYFQEYQMTRSWRLPDLSPLITIDDVVGKLDIPILDQHRLEQLLTQVISPESESIYGRWTGGLVDSRPIEDACATFLGKEGEPDSSGRQIATCTNEDVEEKSLSAQFAQDPVLNGRNIPKNDNFEDRLGLIIHDSLTKP